MATDIYDSIKSPTVRRMMQRFEQADTAERNNRDRGLNALKFRRGGKDQWDTKILGIREGMNSPSESYNQIPQFIHQVTNDMRQNMPQTRFVPETDDDQEKAEIMEDLARAIQSGSEAEVAYDTAAESQVTIGWGYWRYVTEYENDQSFNQVIKLKWIPNPFTVYDDPLAVDQDKLDRKWLIQFCDIARKDFNSDYTENLDGKGIEYDGNELTGTGDSVARWITNETVRVAEYWEVKETTKKLYRTKDGKTTEEKPKGKIDDKDIRDVIVSKVTWYKCTALDVLESRTWEGSLIPYVFVSGEQLNIDGEVYYDGLVEQMMPAQKQYNYWTNAATEAVAMIPKAPYILDPRQIQGYQQYWDQANVKNFPWLPANAIVDGQLIGLPQRANNNVDLNGILSLVSQAQQNFYTTTGIYPASLGKESNEKSGVAIRARQKEGDVSTFHFQDNVARALRAGGRILADLIPKIYDASRSIRVMKEDKTTRDVKINQKFQDRKTGEQKEFDLTAGNYHVMVTTGPSYTTRRQEAQDSMTALAQSYPPIMEVAGDIVVESFDWPGAKQIADRLKATPTIAQLAQSEDGPQDIPPQIQAQIQQGLQLIDQLKQTVQQQGMELQQAQQELQSKQADYQLKMADLQLKQQDMQSSAQSDAAKAQNDQMKLEIEAAKVQIAQQQLVLDEKQMEMDHAQAQMNFYQTQTQPQESQEPGIDINDEGALSNRINVVQQMKAQKQAELEQKAQADANDMQMKSMQTQALMTGLSDIQVMLSSLTNAITAPKQIVRDPATGLVAGVVTQQ